MRTGKLRWTFHVIPRAGETGGVETWKDDSWKSPVHANLWSLVSVDENLGYAYLPLTSPTSDMYGGHRPATTCFRTAIVAVMPGRQTSVAPAARSPRSMGLRPAGGADAGRHHGERPQDSSAVVQVTKQAFAFVFDRVNGQPVWPIEERPFRTSEHTGRAGITDATVSHEASAVRPAGRHRRRLDRLHTGAPCRSAQIVEALRHRSDVHAPFDQRQWSDRYQRHDPASRLGRRRRLAGARRSIPSPAFCTVQSITGPFVADIVPGDPKRERTSTFTRGTREYPLVPRACRCCKPPYGRITAIDLNKGEHVWMVPNGDGRRDHPLLKSLEPAATRQSGPCRPARNEDVAVRG